MSAGTNALPIEPAAAVIGFAAWLTGRRDAVTIGASHDAAIVAELAETFRKSQGWDAPADDFTTRLRSYPAEEQAAPPVARTTGQLDDAEIEELLDQYKEGEPVLRWFQYAHLPPERRVFSRPFAVLALDLVQRIAPSSERTKALDRLLESKDCAVRAAIP